MMKITSQYSLILLIAIALIMSPTVALTASDYDAHYTNPGDELNTTPAAQDAAGYQIAMGYSATPYSDSDAAFAYNQLPNDNLFCFVGHGAPGNIKFHDLQLISANSPNTPNTRLSNYNNGELDDLLLAAYIGCDTGITGSTDGNLLDESVRRGVDTAIGFTSDIYSGGEIPWSKKFWENIKNGNLVVDASHDATDNVIFWDPLQRSFGMENWTIKGSALVNVSLQKTGVIENGGDLINRPSASFTINRMSNPIDGRYQFTDTSTNSPTGFSWYFSDGYTSNQTNPIHGFPQNGYYTVTHTATNQYGTGRVVQSQYFAHNYLPISSGPLQANFDATSYNGMAPLTVLFVDTSSGNPIWWRWNFGTGISATSTEQNPTYTYSMYRDMPYTVDLTVKDSATIQNGGSGSVKLDYITVTSPQPNPILTANKLFGAAPLIVQFTDTNQGGPGDLKYEFGDGGVSYQHNPSHTYLNTGNYTAKLIITNNLYQNSVTKQISVFQSSPFVNFTATPTSGLVPLTVRFNDTSTNNPAAWSWVFGDGNISTLQNPVHTYVKTGNYSINLTVTNSGGTNTTIKRDFIIVKPYPPITTFTATPTIGFVPLTVRFNDTSANNPIIWSWDFGDGNTSTLQNPVHTYVKTGNYSINLTVTNPGGTNSTMRPGYITVRPPPPIAAFSADRTSGEPPMTVRFYDNSTENPGAWYWEFGDGQNATVQNPIHGYTTAGDYTVNLTATNAGGSNKTVKKNYVSLTPDAYTKTLVHLNGTEGSTVIRDETGRSWSGAGNAHITLSPSEKVRGI